MSPLGDAPPAPFELPLTAAGADAAFFTAVLRWKGTLAADQEVTKVERTALDAEQGYQTNLDVFKAACTYSTGSAGTFLCKCYPEHATLPKEALHEQLAKEIAATTLGPEFYPRAACVLAAGDSEANRWAIVFEDPEQNGEHMIYEKQYSFDFVLANVVPTLVSVALAYEGCHDAALNPDKHAELEKLPGGRPDVFAEPEYLTMLQVQATPTAEMADALLASTTTTSDTDEHEWGSWDLEVADDYCETYVKKIPALWGLTRPDKGATCTLCHGDLRGDNMFHVGSGVVCQDFQLLCLAPVPTDLAYFMATASVEPECYERIDEVLTAFFTAFSAKSKVYTPSVYEVSKFREEFVIMSTKVHLHLLSMGAELLRRGEEDELIYAPELGTGDVSTEDLPPAQIRTRDWTKATYENLKCFAKKFGIYQVLQALPDTSAPKGQKTPTNVNKRRSSVAGLLIAE